VLLETVVRKLEADFSSLQFFVDKEKHTIVIPPIQEGFGSIEIEDDGDELIIFVGNFTHWHAGCYGEELSDEDKAKEIAEDVVEFLRDVLNDKVILWGSHKGGGVVYRDEQQNQVSQPATYQKGRWSGSLSGDDQQNQASQLATYQKWLWSRPFSE
jgi:hypothetical protein